MTRALDAYKYRTGSLEPVEPYGILDVMPMSYPPQVGRIPDQWFSELGHEHPRGPHCLDYERPHMLPLAQVNHPFFAEWRMRALRQALDSMPAQFETGLWGWPFYAAVMVERHRAEQPHERVSWACEILCPSIYPTPGRTPQQNAAFVSKLHEQMPHHRLFVFMSNRYESAWNNYPWINDAVWEAHVRAVLECGAPIEAMVLWDSMHGDSPDQRDRQKDRLEALGEMVG